MNKDIALSDAVKQRNKAQEEARTLRLEVARLASIMKNQNETIDEMDADNDKLQAFKNWVHAWLDQAGVPHDPDPEYTAKSGCRIKGRLEWLAVNLPFGQRP